MALQALVLGFFMNVVTIAAICEFDMSVVRIDIRSGNISIIFVACQTHSRRRLTCRRRFLMATGTFDAGLLMSVCQKHFLFGLLGLI